MAQKIESPKQPAIVPHVPSQPSSTIGLGQGSSCIHRCITWFSRPTTVLTAFFMLRRLMAIPIGRLGLLPA